MSTITFYRPIGSAELALIEAGGRRAFPPMPGDYRFSFYTSPEDPADWWPYVNDSDAIEYLPKGAADLVASWPAWGNDPDALFEVSFEVDESRWNTTRDAQDELKRVNDALVGLIEVHATYSLTDAVKQTAELRND